jgi:hypothetical protein
MKKKPRQTARKGDGRVMPFARRARRKRVWVRRVWRGDLGMGRLGERGDLGLGRPEGGVKAIPSLTGSSSDGCNVDPSWVCPHTKLGVPMQRVGCAHTPRQVCPNTKAGVPTHPAGWFQQPRWEGGPNGLGFSFLPIHLSIVPNYESQLSSNGCDRGSLFG